MLVKSKTARDICYLEENAVILVLTIIFAWIIIANRKAKQAKKENIKGLESAQMIRPGYAIEYDFVQPTELNSSLETKKISHCNSNRP